MASLCGQTVVRSVTSTPNITIDPAGGFALPAAADHRARYAAGIGERGHDP